MSLRWKTLIGGVGMAAMVLAGCRKSETATGSAPPTPAAAEAAQHPPFGFLDVPKENDSAASGSWSYGWALDDSGVASVTVSLDNGAPLVVIQQLLGHAKLSTTGLYVFVSITLMQKSYNEAHPSAA